MATNGNSRVNVKQGLAQPGTMDGQQGIVQQPEALPHTFVQQDISQVPLLLHWPTVIVPLNCVPANLNPQMTITFSWNPSQPVTIPCTTMEQQEKVDVACGPSDSECNMGNETGAPLVIDPGLRGRASRRGRGRSCTTRIRARPLEQKDKVGVCFWPSNLECSMENKTGAPLGIEPGLRGHASCPGRGRGANGGTRTQSRPLEQKDKVGVCCWPSNLECSMENTTGAPLGIEPGLRGHASCPGRARGASGGTRTQSRTTETKTKVGVCYWPSNLECSMENKTGAPLGIEPGLRGHASRSGRGRGASGGTRTQTGEHSEALPALGSEKRAHGALLKRRQIRPPSTTKAVAGKPLCHGKKSSARARGHTDNENTACQPEVLPLTSPQEENSQGPPSLCWPPAFSPAPYMTTTLGQQLIALPSMVLHEAFALSNPCVDQTPLPCSSIEYHPPETQRPVSSDQASVSATFECEEILQAAAALMTLKNSSWTWRQTHN